MNKWTKNTAAVLVAVLTLAVIMYAPCSSWAGAADDIYKSKCAMCHGPDGTGDTAMGKKLNIRNLKSKEVQDMKDDQLTEIIVKGKNKMPGYDGKLKPAEIAQVVALIRTMAKK